MKWFRLAGLALCLMLGLVLSWESAGTAQTSSTSGCALCDCNDNRTVCRMSCLNSSTDPSARLRCEVSCTRTYASCMDRAYAAANALQQSAQQATSSSGAATSAGNVSSGS